MALKTNIWNDCIYSVYINIYCILYIVTKKERYPITTNEHNYRKIAKLISPAMFSASVPPRSAGNGEKDVERDRISPLRTESRHVCLEICITCWPLAVIDFFEHTLHCMRQ